MLHKRIVIEGLDAAGKDTQTSRVVNFLKEKNQEAVVFQYPDKAGLIGKAIGSFLKNEFELAPEAQFLLYAMDMLKDREKIQGLLGEGKTVVFNRYLTSAIAYQGTQGFPIEKALQFAEMFDFPKPDLIIYLKISAATAVKRKIGQKTELDRFESKEALLKKIAEKYDLTN